MALSLANTIVQKAAGAWIADRRTAKKRKKELRALLAPRFRHAAPEQRFLDEAASELASFGRYEFRGLDDGYRAAALLAVRDAFKRADLTDRTLFAVDVDAAKLASRLRAGQPRAKTAAGLGEVGGAFYDAALDRCCELYVRAVVQVPTFVGRSLAEMLNRLSDLPDQVAARVLNAWREAQAAVADQPDSDVTRVLDRSPPGPAGRQELVVYLKTLIERLNSDPWPRDRRFAGPVLTPTEVERQLRLSASTQLGDQDQAADDLAQRCWRLVILGGPGAGKTWLAKRTARRCAEHALAVLADGGNLDEVELPLITTCSQLFSANGDIRQAVVSSALDQLGDLGGSRLSAALRVFFTERNAPTLLVIDSLDEAHGSDERLRQAGTLPWRIVLTSRPSSWNHQLVIEHDKDSDQVGELQPLKYPGDVEPFIASWFAARPEWGNDLAGQIAQRPVLQQSATVPLILAFYCILGGEQPLPELRRDLYTRVLRRMLTGGWRSSEDRRVDADSCLRTLRSWAWSGASSDPVSDVGTWADDIPTENAQLDDAEQEALDHVATPIGLPDLDSGKTLRRFIHRSIREHLVAEHIASLPADQAAEALFPHIWYDADWDYSAPAAIAMHPCRDRLLRDLICRAARSDRIPENLSVIDAGWESRGLLARVAAESSQADWQPDLASVIGSARVELAQSGRLDDLAEAAHWHTSNRPVREAVLELLVRETVPVKAEGPVSVLAQLATTAEDKRHSRAALLDLIAREPRHLKAYELARGVVRLDPTAADKCDRDF
jgi:hypothetical protein